MNALHLLVGATKLEACINYFPLVREPCLKRGQRSDENRKPLATRLDSGPFASLQRLSRRHEVEC